MLHAAFSILCLVQAATMAGSFRILFISIPVRCGTSVRAANGKSISSVPVTSDGKLRKGFFSRRLERKRCKVDTGSSQPLAQRDLADRRINMSTPSTLSSSSVSSNRSASDRKMEFDSLPISLNTKKALKLVLKYETMTSIQSEAIPEVCFSKVSDFDVDDYHTLLDIPQIFMHAFVKVLHIACLREMVSNAYVFISLQSSSIDIGTKR